MKLPPPTTNVSRIACDVSGEAVQPKLLVPRARGKTSRLDEPSVDKTEGPFGSMHGVRIRSGSRPWSHGPARAAEALIYVQPLKPDAGGGSGGVAEGVGELGSGSDPELREQQIEMGFDRPMRQIEPLTDVPVR